jgi:maltose alpha-D-glucosyltransferase/alpha-amylase
MENDRRKIEALHCMLLTMPGTPILYYGDEIGMGDNIWLDDRNGVRTPMQWTPASKDDPTAGFSADPCATPFSPIISEEPYDPQHVNVQDALNDASSWFHVLKFMIRVRKSHPCFSKGTLSWVASNPPNISVATFIRQYEISSILVVINLSPKEQRVCITLPSVTRHARYDWKRPSFPSLKRIDVENLKATAIAIDNLIELRDELTLLRYPITTDNTIELDLAPYQFLWLNLREAVFKY